MDTHLAINAETTRDSHDHHWQPIDGWRARYRCRDCGVIARKRGLVTVVNPWEPLKPCGSGEITAYVCTLKCGGLRCGCPAVKKVGHRKWRCRAHLSSSSANVTKGARAVLARATSSDPPRAPHRGDKSRPVEPSTFA